MIVFFMYLDTSIENQGIDILVGNQTGLFKIDDDMAAHNRRFSRIKSPIKREDMFFHAVEATAQRVCPEPITGIIIHFSFKKMLKGFLL